LAEAELYADEYITQGVENGLAEVEMIIDKKACQCRGCMTSAVIKVNQAIELYIARQCVDDEVPDYILFHVETDGGLHIEAPRWHRNWKGNYEGNGEIDIQRLRR